MTIMTQLGNFLNNQHLKITPFIWIYNWEGCD